MARVILDHGAPYQLYRALAGHQVDSAFYHGWAQFRNGELIAAQHVERISSVIDVAQPGSHQIVQIR